MNLFNNIRRAGAPLLIAAAATLSGCSNSFLYEYEGDCDPKYRVRLHYNYHLKEADAFPYEVDHVTLNVTDEQGRIVHTHIESGDALGTGDYEIMLDGKLAPGKYRLHAWCGTGAMPGSTSFAVHEATDITDLRCTLLPDPAEGRADAPEGADGKHVRREIKDLYHGMTGVLEFPDDEGYHYFDVNLMKNTNSVTVTLVQLADSPLEGHLFDFALSTDNARMEHDNAIIPSADVTYHAWRNIDAETEIGDVKGLPEGTQPGTYPAVLGEFNIARVMKDTPLWLNVTRNDTGDDIVRMNLTPYFILSKPGKYFAMPSQEYLDRQDAYSVMIVLDSNYRWVESYIYINSWKVVNQDSEV